MNKLIILKIEMSCGDVNDCISPAVLCDEENRVLVDCGYVGSLPKIEEALRQNGLTPEEITHIILTHHDHDHMGAAAAFKQKYPDVLILASAGSIRLRYQKSLRLEQAERLQGLPEEKAFGGLSTSSSALLNRSRSIGRFGRSCLPFCGDVRCSLPRPYPRTYSLWLRV